MVTGPIGPPPPPQYPRARSVRDTHDRFDAIGEALGRGQAQFAAINVRLGQHDAELSELKTSVKRPFITIGLAGALVAAITFMVQAPTRSEVSGIRESLEQVARELAEARAVRRDLDRRIDELGASIDHLTAKLDEVGKRPRKRRR